MSPCNVSIGFGALKSLSFLGITAIGFLANSWGPLRADPPNFQACLAVQSCGTTIAPGPFPEPNLFSQCSDLQWTDLLTVALQ